MKRIFHHGQEGLIPVLQGCFIIGKLIKSIHFVKQQIQFYNHLNVYQIDTQNVIL